MKTTKSFLEVGFISQWFTLLFLRSRKEESIVIADSQPTPEFLDFAKESRESAREFRIMNRLHKEGAS